MNTSHQSYKQTASHPQYLVFSHQPLLLILILIIILHVCSAFIKREGLQPVLKLTELGLQVASIQLNIRTDTEAET